MSVPRTFDPDLLTEAVVLVTGGSSGIGAAVVAELAKTGATVVVLDVADGADHEADVTDEAALATAFATVAATHGRLDGLVNAAGVYGESTVTETTSEEWSRILAVNITGTFLATKHARAALDRSAAPAIVNIASHVAFVGAPGAAAYAASKGAVVAFTRSCAREFAPDVRVNAIAPGVVPTGLIDRYSCEPGWLEAKTSRLALGRAGTTDEVASIAVWLLSAAASYVTGQTFHINGGGYFG